MDEEEKKRRVLVTGSSRGIGKAVAQAEAGFSNIIATVNANSTTGSNSDRLSTIRVNDLFPDDEEIGENSNLLFMTFEYTDYIAPFFGAKRIAIPDDYVINKYNSNEKGFDRQGAGVAMALKNNPAYLYIVNDFDDKTFLNNIPQLNSIMGQAVFDVNGFDKPNELGKDVFVFDYNDAGKLIPRGYSDLDKCSKDAAVKDGMACAARVVKDGFKILY